MADSDELIPGTITRITRQRKKQERVSIYLDGRFAFGIHQDLLLEFELRKGVPLDVELQRRLLSADEHVRARIRAFDLLSYRSRTAYELLQRLRRAGYSDAAAESAVARLKELDMLDDYGFARDYAEARLANKGYGPHRIKMELRSRGVDRQIIDDVVSQQFSNPDVEIEQALVFARKRMPRLVREPDKHKRRKRLYDALVRRGYSSDVISRVVAECLDS